MSGVIQKKPRITMGSTADFRRAFVERLKEACDASENVPPPNKGRQKYISEQLEVSAEAVSKWFKAVAWPQPDKMAQLAELLKVEQAWLQTGVSPEMDRQERKTHGREVEGAVYYVMGLCMLSGGYCGIPSLREHREYVDFNATVRGTSYAVHVCLGREIGKDRYELVIPKEYEDISCVALIPRSPGRYDQLDLPSELIDQSKFKKSSDFSLVIDRSESGKYITGMIQWQRIRYFGERV